MLAFASFFLTLSSLPLYAIGIGASTGAAGLVTTVMLVSTVVTQTVVPTLVNRFGLVAVLAAGLVLLGAPSGLYLVGRQFALVLAVSVLRGFGFAIITVLMPLLASRLVGSARRGEAIGIYGLAIAVPNLIGVPIGVALTAAGHFRWVALLSLAPLLALPLLRPLAAAMLPPEVAPSGEPLADNGFALKAVVPAVLVLLTVTLAGGGVLTFLPVARPSGTLATVGLLVFGATGALARWRVGVLSDRFGFRVLLPLSILTAATGMLLIGVGLGRSSAVVLLIGAAVLGIGYGAVQNVTLLVAFARAGPANATTASAAWNACYDAGTAVGALLVGLIAVGGAGGGAGFPATFIGCAVLIALGLPLAWRSARKP